MNNQFARILVLALLALLCGQSLSFAAPARSAENQIFQWHVSGENTGWPDGSKNKGTLYLYIPEKTTRVRGVVVLATNVPEHMLVGHPALRRACAENDLALVWGVPSFWRFGRAAPAPGAEPIDVKLLPDSDSIQAAFLEKLLAELAAKSGYAELASAPWFPIGESGHLLMVVGLINARPERVAAGICVKNPHYPQNKTVPLLWTLGTGQEWGQTKSDPRESYLTDAKSYPMWARDRPAANWPLSVIVEPGTGHFACSDDLAEHFGRYLASAARARLSADGSPTLRPVHFEAGVLAHLPLPGQTDLSIIPYSETKDKPSALARPWFFDADLARDAQRISAPRADAAAQLALFTSDDPGVKIEPFVFNSVTRVTVTTDGEFTLRATLADQIPEPFVAAGSPLVRAPGEPIVEWICGPYAPVPGAPGRFRVSLDRAWKNGGASYVIARHEGDAAHRRTVQPAALALQENKTGAPQTITFPPLPDVPAGTASIPLAATADSGLPVSYFVVSGPALIRENQLVFTPLPPHAKFPVEITVAAWQWGRASEPQVRTAALVRQTVHLTAP
jgi:hypothetical protein